MCVCLQGVSGGLKDVCVFTGCEWRTIECLCVFVCLQGVSRGL